MEQSGDVELRARRIFGRWHVHVPGTTFWGEGATVEEALRTMQERQAAFADFEARTGLKPVSVGAWSRLGAGWQGLKKIARPIVIVAACSIPLSYAISTGISRGVNNSKLKVGGADFWHRVETGLYDLASDEKDLSPEQAQRIQAALRKIIDRLRPFTSELSQLFEPPAGASHPSQAAESAQ